VVVVALGAISGPSSSVRAGGLPQANSKPQRPTAAIPPGPLVESREKLTRLQQQILGLGSKVLGRSETANREQLSDAIVNQQITVKSAEARYENAKLTREVAELAVVDYAEGIFPQEVATMEGELRLAQSDFERSEDMTAIVRDKLNKTRTASKGSAPDLAYEYALEDRIVKLELREPRTRLELERAQSKLDFFRQYAKSKRVKELESEVQKAKSEELTGQAQWEREKFKLTTLETAVRRRDREVHAARALSLLEQAVPIVEELKSKLDQAEKNGQPGDAAPKEIADATNRLQAIVEQALQEDAAAHWAQMKPRVHGAAVKFLGAQTR
jgi:hypothetical protein